MNWAEKVDKLLEANGESRSSLARRAGVTIPTFLAHIRKGSLPNASDGAHIARALKVDPFWLFDESAGIESLEVSQAPPNEAQQMRRQIRAAADFFADGSDELEVLWEEAIDLLERVFRTPDIETGAARDGLRATDQNTSGTAG